MSCEPLSMLIVSAFASSQPPSSWALWILSPCFTSPCPVCVLWVITAVYTCTLLILSVCVCVLSSSSLHPASNFLKPTVPRTINPALSRLMSFNVCVPLPSAPSRCSRALLVETFWQDGVQEKWWRSHDSASGTFFDDASLWRRRLSGEPCSEATRFDSDET